MSVLHLYVEVAPVHAVLVAPPIG